jgi:hypothetical protein
LPEEYPGGFQPPAAIELVFLGSHSAAELSHRQPSGRRIEFQLPATFVDGMVMLRTQGNHVVEIGFSAVFPILNVMHIAHMKSPVASIDGAGFVYRF